MNPSVHCGFLSKENRTLLGEADPVSGLAAVDRPNSTFVNWYINCVSEFVRGNDSGLIQYNIVVQPDASSTAVAVYRPYAVIAAYFTEPVLKQCANEDNAVPDLAPDGSFNLSLFFCHWETLPAATRLAYIKHWILSEIGPDDVLSDLGIAPSADVYAQTLENEIEDAAAKKDDRYSFLNRYGDPMTVREVTEILQFLIHLQDTLKY